jgi:hypothetical protein
MIPTDESDTVVAVFDDDGTIGRYDVTWHTPIGPRVDPGFEISSLWTNGERVIVATWAEQRFRLQGIDLDTGTLVGPEIDTDQFEIFQVAFTADAMYTETFPEFRVERRDLDTGELMSEPAEGSRLPPPEAASWSPCGGADGHSNSTRSRWSQSDCHSPASPDRSPASPSTTTVGA